MHGLLGERYLKRFAGNLLNRRKPPAYILLEEQKPQPEKQEGASDADSPTSNEPAQTESTASQTADGESQAEPKKN